MKNFTLSLALFILPLLAISQEVSIGKPLNFEAKSINNHNVSLNWQTTLEVDNDYFTVERSIDGEEWEVALTIEGAGNSSQLLDYASLDEAPHYGVSYYRIKQTNFNGSSVYSDVKSVKTETKNEARVSLYPNPAVDLITIEGNKTELASIRIFNALGQEITGITYNIFNAGEIVRIDISDLKAGFYTIKTNSISTNVFKQ